MYRSADRLHLGAGHSRIHVGHVCDNRNVPAQGVAGSQVRVVWLPRHCTASLPAPPGGQGGRQSAGPDLYHCPASSQGD